MIIYAVSLTVDKAIYDEYMLWMHQHIKDVIQVDGFIGAELLEEQENTLNEEFFHLAVHYSLDSMESLQNYLDNHALKFRGESMKLFSGKSTATRKVFSLVAKF